MGRNLLAMDTPDVIADSAKNTHILKSLNTREVYIEHPSMFRECYVSNALKFNQNIKQFLIFKDTPIEVT